MIYLILMKCGLGNQMFSYAYARYLQELHFHKNKVYESIVINSYQFSFGSPANIVEERRLSLQHFQLTESSGFLKESDQKINKKQYLYKIETATGLYNKFIRKYFYSKTFGELNYRHRFRRGLYVSYRPHSSFCTVLSKSKEKYVFGYYQDAKPLCKIQDILKKDFKITTPPNKKTQTLLVQIQNTNAVCLHIRRGDYLVPECKHLNICGKEYYQRGIRYIQERVKNPTFFLFSNCHEDLEWIKNYYHLEGSNMVYVDLQNPDYEDLRLMKACRHFVISNSSFSWWAAFLSEHQEKIVCMPERWDLEYPGDANMYVPGWVKLPVEEK